MGRSKAEVASQPRIIRPQAGKQELFLRSPADICIYGGAAGGGKTYALLLECLRHIDNPRFEAVIFRQSRPQIMNAGGLYATSQEIYPNLGATSVLTPSIQWRFPSGAKVTFAYMFYEKEKYNYQGAQIPLLMFDELVHFTESQFFCGTVFHLWQVGCGIRFLGGQATFLAESRASSAFTHRPQCLSMRSVTTWPSALAKPTWNNYPVEMLTITYGTGRVTESAFTGETNAGTYKAYATPKEGYTWGDKSATEREITWSIQRATIAEVPSVTTSLVYTGEAQAPVWKNLNTTQLTKTETAQTNAGDYSSSFAPTANFQWPDGTTAAKTVAWSIAKATLTVPTQSGTLTYNGSAQSPTLSNYDANKMTLGGDTSGTTAKGYAATVTPKANYQWPDGSTSAKSVPWVIGKAANTLTISPATIKINAPGETAVISVTRAGDGVVSATSNKTNIATVSKSGDYFVVTGVAVGSATITVKVAGGTNYLAPANKTCAVTVEAPKIYGASWDGTSTTKWTRTDAAASFTDPVPAVNNGNGSSPFDNIQPWAGMTKSNRTGGVMVSIPKFWYKITQNGAGMKVQIANQATAGFSVSPAHMNRGDGKGERDVVYIGRYHCHTSDYKSKTGGKPKASVTRSAARTAIHNLGTNIWQMDFAMRFTIWLLYIVEFADWNSQAKIGYGCGNNSGTENMGYTDAMTYHTGTKLSSRTTYGLGTQYRWIEGLWDNVLDWMDGCYYNSNGMNVILNPNSFSDSANGVSIGTPSSGWPSAFSVKSVSGAFPTFIPTAASGSESTYSCDSWSFYASGPCLCVGGSYGQGTGLGLFCVSYSGVSDSSAGIGCRLQELP